MMDMSGCKNLTQIPDLSEATNLESLTLNNCKSLVMLPSTIGNLQKLIELKMKGCTGLEVLPTLGDVNLSSLRILDLSGCSSLRTFPQISISIECLYLENTAIEEVPPWIEHFSRLIVLMMYCCKRLKYISPNIFSMTSLQFVDFADCRGAILSFSDASEEDYPSSISLYENIEYTPRRKLFRHEMGTNCYRLPNYGEYFSFQNCFKLERDVGEGILRLCFKSVALPGEEVPTYFQHRAYGDSLTVTLPQSTLSQELLKFKACIVVDFPTEDKDWCSYLEVKIGFNGRKYRESFFGDGAELQLCKTDHLFSCSFMFRPKNLPSKSAFNNVEFKFSCFNRIKECGVRLLNVSPYPDN